MKKCLLIGLLFLVSLPVYSNGMFASVAILTCKETEIKSGTFFAHDECFSIRKWPKVMVYHQPVEGSKKIGMLQSFDSPWQGSQSFNYRLGFTKFNQRDSNQQTHLMTKEVGYEAISLPIYQIQSNWLKFHEGWVKTSDLPQHLKVMTWKEILPFNLSKGDELYAAPRDMYDQPNGYVINHMKNFDYEVVEVLEHQDGWVKVWLKDKSSCAEKKEHSGLNIHYKNPRGWIKMWDDQGSPLVYWMTRGC